MLRTVKRTRKARPVRRTGNINPARVAGASPKKSIGIVSLCALLAGSGPLYGGVLYFLSVKQAVSSDCPIVLDLNGNGLIDVGAITTAQRQVYTIFSIPKFIEFDLSGDGNKQKIDWVLPNTDGFLLDLSKGAPPKEINGQWLFANTPGYENGFQRLAEFDKDKDGTISGDELADLALWIDNGDGLFETAEMKRLSDFDITSLPTAHDVMEGEYGGEKMVGYAYTSTDLSIYMEDVWFLNEFDLFEFDREFSALWR
ncbi:hypothetical protein [Shinella sp. G-2]|uniref:hypothetical protein n=1 Tax=Shinella sp. G-2 TaxID=3133141 RepID=UPI003CFE1514